MSQVEEWTQADDVARRRYEKTLERAEIVSLWLDWIEELYQELVKLSSSELASLPGFDNKPDKKPCECRIEWRRGKLCMACENTGWRNLAQRENPEEHGIDPYAVDLPKHRHTLVESEGTKRAREGAHLDNIIDGLRRNARVRAGAEGTEDRSLRQFRQIQSRAHRNSSLRHILWALQRIQAQKSLVDIPRSKLCMLVAVCVAQSGQRLRPPPS